MSTSCSYSLGTATATGVAASRRRSRGAQEIGGHHCLPGGDGSDIGTVIGIDPSLTATGIYVVDFNVAYNPYCYYSPEFDCPYPPKENRLDVAIRAVPVTIDGELVGAFALYEDVGELVLALGEPEK